MSQTMQQPGYFTFRPAAVAGKFFVEVSGKFAGLQMRIQARRSAGTDAIWYDLPVSAQTGESPALGVLTPADGVPVCYTGETGFFDLVKVSVVEMSSGPVRLDVIGNVEKGPFYFSGDLYIAGKE